MFSYLKGVLLLSLMALVLTFTGALFAKAQFFNKVPPRTMMSSIHLSDLARLEAEELIKEKVIDYLNSQITVSFIDPAQAENPEVDAPEHVQKTTPFELGVNIDIESMLGSLPLIVNKTSLIEMPDLLISKKTVPILFTIDREKASTTINTLFPEISKQGNNAHFSLREGQLILIPEQFGRELDMPFLLNQLSESISALETDTLVLGIKEYYPVILTSDLSSELAALQTKLAQNITLEHEEKKLDVRPLDQPEWISFDYRMHLQVQYRDFGDSSHALLVPIEFNRNIPEPDLPFGKTIQVAIELDKQSLSAYFDEQITGKINIESQGVTISKNEDGTIMFEGTGVNGKQVEVALLTQAFQNAVNQNINEITIPVKNIPAPVYAPEEVRELGIKELVGVGYSNFYGSPPSRNHNIKIGISRFNGVLVKPGETFSFNDVLGPVDGAHGFKKELTIVGNDTRPEYGGGLCQVSSTFFRGILDAGLPYTERFPHSYAVTYYFRPSGPGLDATIYPGHKDVKFINDSPGHLLIQSYMEGQEAYFKFYGTHDGRAVSMQGPFISDKVGAPSDVIIETDELAPGERKKVDSAHDGFDALWYRTVAYPSGETKKDKIFSHYRAWPAKYMLGKKKEGQENS